MKKQQVISRFFAAKPSASSAPNSDPFREQPVVSPPPRIPARRGGTKAAEVLEWPPPRRRRTLDLETQPSSAKRKEILGTSALGIAGTSTGAEGEDDDCELQAQNKRSRLDSKGNGALQAPGVRTSDSPEHSADVAANEVSEGGSKALIPVESDPVDDIMLHEVPDSSPASPRETSRTLEVVSGNGLRNSFGSTPPAAPQRKTRALPEIPASDPIKHRRFVDRLLARVHANGDVKKSWYGTPPAGNEKLTPLETQVADLKAKYPDVLLMVEVGYRYRFYGDDAETASRVLGIAAYYDHSFLTASVPTFRLHFHVRRLVEAGLKVGVVRQTETAAIKAHGANKAGPFSRGLSALYTRATLEAAEDLGGGAAGARSTRLSSYLMCIAERPVQESKKIRVKGARSMGNEANGSTRGNGAGNGGFDTEFGVVAIEVATGDVMFGSIKDTVVRSELEGRLITSSPAELLLASPLSSATEKLIMEYAGPASDVRVERVSRDCFNDGGALAEVVDFYTATDGDEKTDLGENNTEKVDEGLEVVMKMPDIVVQALALGLRYLKQFNLENVLKLGRVFRPFSCHYEMTLPPNALRQLEILKNSTDGSERGSLLWLMDHTETAFGARLLRYWVTHPLCDHKLIAARQDAVMEIAGSMGGLGTAQIEGTFPEIGLAGGTDGVAKRGRPSNSARFLQQGSLGGLLNTLGKLPDMERGITRIFHRTATAGEFVSVIQSLLTSAKHLQRLQFQTQDADSLVEGIDNEEGRKARSPLLQRLVSAASSATMCEHAMRLLSAVNTDAAIAGDKLKLFNCADGRFPEVAKCRLAIKAAEMELDGYLPGLQKLLRNPKLQFVTISGLSHLVEAPVAQRVPANWMKINSTKKTIRYHPPEILESRDKLALAREELVAASTRAWEMFLVEFASHYIDFRASVQALAALDCLHSLALVSRNQGYVKPEFAGEDEPSQLVIESGRHPILDVMLQDSFVPNDTVLCGNQERCQIITGPNMGGKSCYIRQVALIAIMAQVGSYIPAASAKLHVFDSVQTRMGASDSLHKGASTFFEELSETSAILRTATSRSLVILDELGRGTSTHDGVAIAYAALQHLLKETRCLTLFVTHYPKITELKEEFPGEVNSYYVSYMAQESLMPTEMPFGTGEDVDAFAEVSQDITFLYKLVPGVASRSFGLHVARLAKIPETCVRHAAVMAAKFEKEVGNRNYTSSGMNEGQNGAIALLEMPSHASAIFSGDYTEGSTREMFQNGVDILENGVRVDSPPRSASSPARSSSELRLVTLESCTAESEPNVGSNGRKRIPAAEAEELLSSIRDILKEGDAEIRISLLKDIQRRVVAAI